MRITREEAIRSLRQKKAYEKKLAARKEQECSWLLQLSDPVCSADGYRIGGHHG